MSAADFFNESSKIMPYKGCFFYTKTISYMLSTSTITLRCYRNRKGNFFTGIFVKHTRKKKDTIPRWFFYLMGLAFDLHRNRLGHGKGYYDKYLTKCRQWTKPPIAMALALDSQILKDKDIPVTDSDQKPDFILSPYQDIKI
ncbi:hypothetical protein C2G38_2143301 [Gigaspora rosea]|uniref:5-formyltetrahydrofolate cyclo-ligase n=1 Tax=Gigaspora rosea TaxID=44941 RepID=A0A397V0S5_9GLOM|nr:hypothetical protein C2G38_2143301 [Gigaspora rosea]